MKTEQRTKRIQVSLTETDYLILKRLSCLNGTPMSKIVGELVEMVTPSLGMVADNIEILKNGEQEVRDRFAESVNLGVEKLEGLLAEAQQESDEIFSVLSEAASPPSSNTGVRILTTPTNSGGKV